MEEIGLMHVVMINVNFYMIQLHINHLLFYLNKPHHKNLLISLLISEAQQDMHRFSTQQYTSIQMIQHNIGLDKHTLSC